MPRFDPSKFAGADAPPPMEDISPPSVPLSPQQEHIIDFVRNGKGNAIIMAVAGSGKTTTLIELCKHLGGTASFAAFNKKIADEIGMRLLREGVDKKRIKSSTFHSFGFAAIRRAYGNKVRVDGDKVEDIIRNTEAPRNLHVFIRMAVSLAKQRGFGVLIPMNDLDEWEEMVYHHDLEDRIWVSDDGEEPVDLIPDGIEWAQHVLQLSNLMSEKLIDFDDMIYIPLVYNLSIWKTDWVLIDEAQDTNPTRLALAERMLKSGGRLIAVGDPHQAIYGFTGADHSAMDHIERHFKCQILPLTVSYRCPKKVVAYAQNWVSHIEAAPDAPEGKVETISQERFRRLEPGPSDVILCRINKPLIEMALDFLRRRIPCHVEGRDIGHSLLALVNRWKSISTIHELEHKLEDYLSKESARLIEKGKEGKLQAVEDRVGSLQAIMGTLSPTAPIKELEDVIYKLFKDTEGQKIQSVTLSSVHKAKGREWDHVWLYGRNKFMPSKFAKQAWQILQENNLVYVAVTRAKQSLTEVELFIPENATHI